MIAQRTANALLLQVGKGRRRTTFSIYRWDRCARLGLEVGQSPEGLRIALTCLHRSFILHLDWLPRQAYKTWYNRARY